MNNMKAYFSGVAYPDAPVDLNHLRRGLYLFVTNYEPMRLIKQ